MSSQYNSLIRKQKREKYFEDIGEGNIEMDLKETWCQYEDKKEPTMNFSRLQKIPSSGL
jgi:hypothetical protein